MDNFSLLFKNVDANDKKGLLDKGFAAAKVLRLFAVIAVVVTLIIAVPIVLASGLLAGVGVSMSGANVATASSVAGGLTAVFLTSLLLFIGMIGQIITLWYTGKLKKQLENNEIPGMVLPIIFILLNLSSLYSSIRPEFNILGIVIYGFIVYLWFVIINTINKLSNL